MNANKKIVPMVRNVRALEISVPLDRERKLRLDLNAFAKVEEEGLLFHEAMKGIVTGSMKAVRAVLWAGLSHEDETLTLKEVGAMVTARNLSEVTDALVMALNDAMPEAEEKPAGEEAPVDPT